MIKVSIIGASGYSGMELIKLLSARDDIEIEHLFSKSLAGKYIFEVNPYFSNESDLKFEKYEPALLKGGDIVFISLPSGESMGIVNELFSLDLKIIDFGGDFRLKNPIIFEKYYNIKHKYPELLQYAAYGLSELNMKDIAGAKLVANPGCYPTSIIIPLFPLLKKALISSSGIVISSLSGASGAGKKESFEYSFTELNENVRAYKLSNHQHIPEIKQVLESICEENLNFTFIPQLVPINRGIYSTIVADLKSPIDKEYLSNIFNEFYGDSEFVRLRDKIINLKDVVNTNYCDVYFEINDEKKKITIISALDNLLKGAAGQAVQNMNIMFSLPENLGFFKNALQYV